MHGELARFEADGLALAGEAFGDPAAPPVLFFHGGGQSRNAWRGSARIVGEAGYYGIAFDLRGHGDSDWATDGDYLLDAYARDIERLLYRFDRPVTLVGASRGGQAALVGGSRHPARTRLIALADVAPDLREDGLAGIRSFFAESMEGFATLEEAAQVLARNLGRERIAQTERLAGSMRRDDAGRWHWRWDPATGARRFLYPPSENAAVVAAAERVETPVVLVRAERSHLVTDAGVARFRDLAPQLEVFVALGVGHMFTADRNDAFAPDLLGWLDRIPEKTLA